MRPTRPSMQELIGRRKRAGFVGRRAEIERFRGNFDAPPDDERHSFVFHIHGMAGVGKSSLLRELEAVAAGRGAVVGTADETVNSVPEAMAAISARFARQGTELKALDKLLATYRQRRHEAESASVSASAEPGPGPGPGAAPPSAGSMAMAQAGLIGLGMLPGVGAFAGAVDPTQVAQRAEQLRAALSARFRNHDDVQLVLEPLKVLTPVFVAELNQVAENSPWIALFFDTYERTAPFLDPWLLDVITTGRHGTLPANVVVTMAGQHGPDPARWGDYAGFVTEFALEPFTESEARQLLAAKGVVEERVVREVLRLSDCLPVLVSTLAEHRGDVPGTVGDPAASAVERFLKWERDPGRREAALACAFPRRLDEDVFRVVVGGETDGSYAWLCGLPFVSGRAGRVRYHDVVRTAMLRLQRVRSPRLWAERHTRLAEAYGGWRAQVADGLVPDDLWFDEAWRELRTEEEYHLLCAGPRAALRQVLGDVVDACRADPVAARGFAQALYDAGEQTGVEELRAWGRELLAALSQDSDTVLAVMELLLDRAGLDAAARAEAHSIRGRELRQAGQYDRALVECDRAVELDPASARAYHGRGVTRAGRGDHSGALADLDRADGLRPDTTWIIVERAGTLQELGRHEEALAAFDRVLALDPVDDIAWANRAYTRHALGDDQGALADFGRALEIDDAYLWALVHRAEVYRGLGRLDESFADLDRAVAIAPDLAWIASERGDAYRTVGRYEEAAEELGRAGALDGDYASAHAGRGAALAALHRHEEARAAFDRAIGLDPTYVWALVQRSFLRRDTGDARGRFADLDRAVMADSGSWALVNRGIAHRVAGRCEEALADYDLALEREPDLVRVRAYRGLALLRLGREAEAFEELDGAVELDPDPAGALGLRSVAHRERGRFREALQDLEQALSLQPDRAHLHADRAETLMAVGRLPQAITGFERFIEIGGDPVWGHRGTAGALMLCGRYDDALRVLDTHRALLGQADAFENAQQRWAVQSFAGRWERVRPEAEWLYAHDVEYGAYVLAMAVSLAEGMRTAAPLWREAWRRRPTSEGDAGEAFDQAVLRWGLGDRSAGDALFAKGLSLYADWKDLAFLVLLLRLLTRCPGADLSLLGPRLAAVTAARDAVRLRYAECTAEGTADN